MSVELQPVGSRVVTFDSDNIGWLGDAAAPLDRLNAPPACVMVPEADATLNAWHPFDWEECPGIPLVSGGWAPFLMLLWTPWLAMIITVATEVRSGEQTVGRIEIAEHHRQCHRRQTVLQKLRLPQTIEFAANPIPTMW